ncbi:MAG: Fe-S protein assembly co-chaperone HscB [Myxococcales bacterium]|nr:Fe-S protein assembly co-chaperone HscB [Myxococcales bacterium]
MTMSGFDPFAQLGLERRFDLDLEVVERTHRELSRALHPDKFSGGTPAERRAAIERASAVNEAWRTVRDPVSRAEALFRLAGVPVGEVNEPKTAPAFLMEIMEMREELAEARGARDLARVEKLAAGVRAREARVTASLASALASGAEPAAALPMLGELRFYKRFLEEVSAIEDEAMEHDGAV